VSRFGPPSGKVERSSTLAGGVVIVVPTGLDRTSRLISMKKKSLSSSNFESSSLRTSGTESQIFSTVVFKAMLGFCRTSVSARDSVYFPRKCSFIPFISDLIAYVGVEVIPGHRWSVVGVRFRVGIGRLWYRNRAGIEAHVLTHCGCLDSKEYLLPILLFR